ncbi:MAG: formate hydrogenase [Leptospiraceae bacterium]|nr:formate hydrogenase [Leptospiraceae bacterium]
MNLYHIITALSLILPIPIGTYMGKDFLGIDFPLFMGLVIQAIVGNIILLYVRGYEHDKLKQIFIGYFLFFGGLSGSYLAGKSSWLWFYWELTTLGAFFIYSGQGYSIKAIRSLIALFLGSGISMVLIAAWVFLPEGTVGYTFLLGGVLIKAAFSTAHIWLPEAHSGPPAHGSAAYSGLLINLPLLLFVRYVMPHWNEIGLATYLIPIAGIGVFFGGVSAFFSSDVKKALAYSTIENSNFMWLCLFLVGLWIGNSDPGLDNIGRSFLILFYITIIHHALSKTFQFLSVGYLCKIGNSTWIDELKGVGRLSGISASLLGVGAFSFSLLPGSTGFISEATLLYLNSLIIDLPTTSSIFVLPAIVFIIFGLAMGSAAHLRIYLPLSLSVPNPSRSLSVAEGSLNPMITLSLRMLGGLIFLLPLSLPLYVYYIPGIAEWVPEYLKVWVIHLTVFSAISVLFFLSIMLFKWMHRIKKRRLWDCGSDYAGSELSIRSSVISEPLFLSSGRYFHYKDGVSKVDDLILRTLSFSLNLGKLWIDRVESGSLPQYLSFSAVSLLISSLGIYVLKVYL